VNTPKGKGHFNGHWNQIRTGKRNENESGKVGTAGKGNAKAKNWKAQ
jgi:hypothetical protein